MRDTLKWSLRGVLIWIVALVVTLPLGCADPLVRWGLQASDNQRDRMSRLGNSIWTAPKPAMFDMIGDGKWKILCLAGGYTHPLNILRQNPPLAFRSFSSWRSAIAGRLLQQVREGELAVIWVDDKGAAEILYFNFISDSDDERWCSQKVE